MLYEVITLEGMPADSHPMCMFNTAILCMEKESIFRKRYDEGMTKDNYWDATLEDALEGRENPQVDLTTEVFGRYAISLLSGHLGGANRSRGLRLLFAQRAAAIPTA